MTEYGLHREIDRFRSKNMGGIRGSRDKCVTWSKLSHDTELNLKNSELILNTDNQQESNQLHPIRIQWIIRNIFENSKTLRLQIKRGGASTMLHEHELYLHRTVIRKKNVRIGITSSHRVGVRYTTHRQYNATQSCLNHNLLSYSDQPAALLSCRDNVQKCINIPCPPTTA